MWDVVIDVLMPTGGRRSPGKGDGKTVPVQFRVPGAFRRGLNDSGWLDDEVVAAGLLRQGKAPSLLAMVTGAALIDVVRPRPSKELPREFTLAVTADRVIAFAMSAWAEGDGTTDHVVKIKRDERGSWPRELVRVTGDPKEGTLELPGAGPIPVTWDGDPSTGELVALLAG